ncbi:phage tail protein, partial [Rhodobacteraceae bacterium R_SAG2]|nr:phage tail protein [Rhodobacteraceae bacterium R_SAG2]
EYGRQAGAVEAVLRANPLIAKVAHRLPAGVLVVLPDLQPQEGDGMLRLWS